MMKIVRYIFIIGLISLFASSCSKDEPRYSIPARPVAFTIRTNFLDDNLNNVGNFNAYLRLKDKESYEKLTNGVKGLTVLNGERAERSSLGYSGLLIMNIGASINPTPFAVFDLCCPNEDIENIRIVPTNEGVAMCPQCKSTYDIFSGTGRPLSGPALEKRDFLQTYYITPVSQYEFRIFYREN